MGDDDMMRALISVTLLAGLTAGCARVSESPINPLNWFSRDGANEAVAPADIRPLVPERRVVRTVDNRAIVQQVTSLEVVPTSGGAIIQATGVASRPGTYSAALVQRGRSGNTLSYEIRTFAGGGGGGSTVSVAEFVSNADLAGITRVEVSSATNTLARNAR